MQQPQGLNLYPYVRNNPINFTDPDGLDWFKRQRSDGNWDVNWFKGSQPPAGWERVDIPFEFDDAIRHQRIRIYSHKDNRSYTVVRQIPVAKPTNNDNLRAVADVREEARRLNQTAGEEARRKRWDNQFGKRVAIELGIPAAVTAGCSFLIVVGWASPTIGCLQPVTQSAAATGTSAGVTTEVGIQNTARPVTSAVPEVPAGASAETGGTSVGRSVDAPQASGTGAATSLENEPAGSLNEGPPNPEAGWYMNGPEGPLSPGRGTNCINCALGLDDLWAGRSASRIAAPRETGTVGELEAGLRARNIGQIYESGPVAGVKRWFTSEFPIGSRGVAWSEGHVFNCYINADGEVIFLDPQSGAILNPDGWVKIYYTGDGIGGF